MSTLNEHDEHQTETDHAEAPSAPCKKLSLVRDTFAVYRVKSGLRTAYGLSGTYGPSSTPSKGCVGKSVVSANVETLQ
jgi:hypothetical protein